MFSKILIPTDLRHADVVEKAVSAGAYLAKSQNVPIVFAAAASKVPGALAHTPEQFRARLDSYAASQADRHGITASGHAVFTNDPVAELEDALLRAVSDTGADLVVMATHVPDLPDLIWPSNGGRIASHADISVFLVR